MVQPDVVEIPLSPGDGGGGRTPLEMRSRVALLSCPCKAPALPVSPWSAELRVGRFRGFLGRNTGFYCLGFTSLAWLCSESLSKPNKPPWRVSQNCLISLPVFLYFPCTESGIKSWLETYSFNAWISSIFSARGSSFFSTVLLLACWESLIVHRSSSRPPKLMIFSPSSIFLPKYGLFPS